MLSAHIARADLEGAWIGAGAALEWIAMRGQEIPESNYGERYDNAAEALVSALTDMPPEIAESLVRGQSVSEPDSPLDAVPAGIWPLTACREGHENGKPYFLIGVDGTEEWEGAILGLDRGYRRVQVRTSFLLEYWPPDHPAIEPKRKRKRFAIAELRQLIEKIIAKTPPELEPLRKSEIAEITQKCMPEAPRDVVRKILGELKPDSKTGPLGARDQGRKARIEEFGEKMLSAKLRN